MKLRLIAATLAVMALGTTSIMAEGLKGMPETPLAIVEYTTRWSISKGMEYDLVWCAD